MKNRLFELRQERDISQEDLAKRTNISQQTISRYESGKITRVDINLEENLCDFFDCSLDYLRYRSAIRDERKHSETLKKVAKMIEDFYAGDNEKKQDLTDEELASFLEFILKFKDLLQKFPKQ